MSSTDPIDALHLIISAAVLLPQFGCFQVVAPAALRGAGRSAARPGSKEAVSPFLSAAGLCLRQIHAAAVAGVARGLSCMSKPATLSGLPPHPPLKLPLPPASAPLVGGLPGPELLTFSARALPIVSDPRAAVTSARYSTINYRLLLFSFQPLRGFAF